MSEDEKKPEPERLRAENSALEGGAERGGHPKVNEKGALYVYGSGRFPTTLSQEQWYGLLETAEDIKSFIAECRGSGR